MSKYHPIDVRYKGPSTAHRGSARQQTSSFQKMAKLLDPVKSQPAAAPSPWGNAKAKPQRRATPPAVLTVGPNSKETTGGLISVKNIYVIVAGIIVLLLFLR